MDEFADYDNGYDAGYAHGNDTGYDIGKDSGREEIRDEISRCLSLLERGDLDTDEFIGAMRSLAVGVDPRQAAGWPLDNN